MSAPFRQAGLGITELLISLAIGSMIVFALGGLLSTGLDVRQDVYTRLELTREARFAMERMVSAARDTQTLLLPLADNPATSFPENIRSQTSPPSPPLAGSTLATAVMAVATPPDWDIDNDGVADADNDGDGRIDEDLPADTQFDGKAGIRDFDDDGNGTKDFIFSPSGDDDESNDFAQSEDPVNGLDDDADGSIDEDPAADNNGDGAPGVAGVDDDGDGITDEGSNTDDDEDGQSDEDWFDPLVYYLQGSQLIERRAVPWDTSGDSQVTGRDFVESVIADNVALVEFERYLPAAGEQQRLGITLSLSNAAGETVSLATAVRIGGGN